MKRLSRVSVTVDNQNHVIVVRLFSLREPSDRFPDLIDHLKEVGNPWAYHAILDFRRYEADLTPDYLEFLVGKWISLEAGRNTRSCLAVITNDLMMKARLMPLAEVLPHRDLCFFETFDEGLDWIKTDQRRSAA